MIQNKRVLAVIPARSGSKGIPHKNIKMLKGKPLMAYSIEAAKSSIYIDEVMVSTDSREYAEVARDWGAQVPFLRPAQLAADTSKTIEAIIHVRDEYEALGKHFDILVILQPTSPFRTALDIDGSLECFMDHDMQGLVSVRPCETPPQFIRTMKDGKLDNVLKESSTIRRQDLPSYVEVNGAVYVNKLNELTLETSLNDNPIGFLMDRIHSLDIDEPIDFFMAELIMDANRKVN